MSPNDSQFVANPPSYNPWSRVGTFAAINSTTEISLGSLLHSMQIPFAGHLLANGQGVVLTAFLNRRTEFKRYLFFVSAISGTLKSLSPTGKRFRPMLGIFTQGLLFHSAVNLLGAGALGVVVGQMLLGAWCSIQPYLFQYLFFGKDLLNSYTTLFKFIEHYTSLSLHSPFQVLTAWVILNAVVSSAIGLWAYHSLSFQKKVLNAARTSMSLPLHPRPMSSTPWSQSLRQSLGELKRPHFLYPFVFVLFFAWLGNSSWDHMLYIALRATLVAFLFLLLIQRLDFLNLIAWMKEKGWDGPAQALETALEEISGQFNLWKPQKH